MNLYVIVVVAAAALKSIVTAGTFLSVDDSRSSTRIIRALRMAQLQDIIIIIIIIHISRGHIKCQINKNEGILFRITSIAN